MAEEKTTKAENAEVKETKNKTKDNVTKVKMKPSTKGDDSIVKIDLSKPPIDKSEEVEQQPAEKEEEVVVVNEEPKVEIEETTSQVEEQVEEVQDEKPVVEEITDEEVEEVQEEVEEAIAEAEATGKPLPENIQKLVWKKQVVI